MHPSVEGGKRQLMGDGLPKGPQLIWDDVTCASSEAEAELRELDVLGEIRDGAAPIAVSAVLVFHRRLSYRSE